MAKAGFLAGAKYATASAGTLFTAKDKRDDRRKEILSARAQELVEELGSLKGSVVKIGQMMALFGEHFLPEEVTTALHTLENQTTALEWPAIERHLKRQLGEVKLAELEIEEQPLGAASLAQVHKAVRKSDGKELCLNIQYPGVADAIDSDKRALVRLLQELPAKVNLIPFNSFSDSGFERSSQTVIDAFREKLTAAGIVTITRKTRGDDIAAACGQLVGEVQAKARRHHASAH